jgi:hypothetical protein
MSTPINDGGPAFPTDNEGQNGPNSYHFQGMTLRDYFAAQTLTGILSSGDAKLENIISDKSATAVFAQSCYIIADAMLAARKEASK